MFFIHTIVNTINNTNEYIAAILGNINLPLVTITSFIIGVIMLKKEASIVIPEINESIGKRGKSYITDKNTENTSIIGINSILATDELSVKMNAGKYISKLPIQNINTEDIIAKDLLSWKSLDIKQHHLFTKYYYISVHLSTYVFKNNSIIAYNIIEVRAYVFSYVRFC